MDIKHVVHFSSGAGSWAAAKRVVERHGTEGVVLLFADTLIEDEDNYRFLDEAAENVGCPLVKISDGRTPWELFFDEKMMGNSRADLCSRVLKRDLLWNWADENCTPETVHHFGISWDEIHRFRNLQKARPERKISAPMCDRPFMSKQQILEWIQSEGLTPPRLYDMGFNHANCAGFCIKAGQAHFLNLLKHLPERYAHHEAKEQEFREYVGKDVSILRDRRGGETTPLTLKELRERHEAGDKQLDLFDWGGCGCAID